MCNVYKLIVITKMNSILLSICECKHPSQRFISQTLFKISQHNNSLKLNVRFHNKSEPIRKILVKYPSFSLLMV